MTEPFKFKLAHDHSRWKHSHNYAFGNEAESERRTFWVMLLTAAMTIIEIGAGGFTTRLRCLPMVGTCPLMPLH